jgi:hypothetical protein
MSDSSPSAALVRLDPQALISQAITTGADIGTIERLVALAKDIREVQAREAWYSAMAEFQRLCPPIKKTATARIQTARASYSYSYAPLDEILSEIQPVMGPLGLSVSWRSRVETDKVIVSCRVAHRLGHYEESGDIAMPIVTADADRGANPAQRVGIAATYAKRYALLGIIGLAPEDDDDAQSAEEATPPRAETAPPLEESDILAEPISEAQQKRLWAIAREHKWDSDHVKDLLTSFHHEHTREILRGAEYERVIDRLKQGPPAGTQARLA